MIQTPILEQAAMAAAVLLIKPLYTLFALGLIITVWRLKAPEMKVLRWGLVSFLAGEMACAVNIIFFNHGNYLLEYFHMSGMIISFSFFIYAVMELVDRRVIHYSGTQKQCAMLGMCRQCVKNDGGTCAITRISYFIVPVLMILAAMPLLAATNTRTYDTQIFGFTYNASHPVIYQVFEMRIAPVIAMILLAASLVTTLLFKGKPSAVPGILFAAGAGALGFSLLRTGFWGIYGGSLLWPNIWEEVTELMYVSGIGFMLWIFRKGLFAEKKSLEKRLPTISNK